MPQPTQKSELPPPLPPTPKPRPIHIDRPPLPSPILPHNRDILNTNVLKSAPGKPQLQTTAQVKNVAEPLPHFNLKKVETPALHDLPAPTPAPPDTVNIKPQPIPTEPRDTGTVPAPLSQPEIKHQSQLPANAPETLKPIKAEKVQAGSDRTTQPKDPIYAPFELINKRTELESIVRWKITNPKEREQFLADMRTFESDFKERSTKSEVDKQVEMANTYTQLSRLLNKDNDVLSRYPRCKQAHGETPWRIQAAEQVMHQAAEPTSVDQGVLAVCPTAALQVRQYWRDPSAVARLVTDVLLTGSYTATTGDKKIDLTQCPDNLIPDTLARNFSIEKQIKGEPVHVWKGNYTNLRSFASQIFDVATTNIILSGRGYRYEQPSENDVSKKENNAQGYAVSLSGQRLAWGEAIKAGITVKDIELSRLNYLITGRLERGFVVVGAPLTNLESQDRNIRKFLEFINRDSCVSYLYTKADMSNILLSIEKAGQWPPIASVDTNTEPFLVENGGSHFITITSASNDLKKLAFDNTWGRNKDKNGTPQIDYHTMSASILSNASRLPSQAGAVAPLINFKKTHPTIWAKQIKDWADLTDKVNSSQQPQQEINSYLLRQKDNILVDWLKRHPDDKRLQLWQLTLGDWINRYPEESHKHN